MRRPTDRRKVMHILLYSDGIFSQLSFGRVRFVFFQNQRAFLRRLSCSLKNLCVCASFGVVLSSLNDYLRESLSVSLFIYTFTTNYRNAGTGAHHATSPPPKPTNHEASYRNPMDSPRRHPGRLRPISPIIPARPTRPTRPT